MKLLLILGEISAVVIVHPLRLAGQSQEQPNAGSGQAAVAPAAAPKPPELTSRQKVMSQFDVNKNGKLEPTEREAYLKHQEDERKKFIQQFDTDGDGVLDEDERNTARAFYFQKKLEAKAAAQSAAAQAAGQAGVQASKASAPPAVPAK